MKKIWMIWLFILLFFNASQIDSADLKKRIIKVVVWNDAKHPVKSEIIKKNLAICFKEYKDHAGIVFKWDGKILIYKPKNSYLFISDPDKNYYFFRNLSLKYIDGQGYIYVLGKDAQWQIVELNKYLTPHKDIELKIFFSDVATRAIVGMVISQKNGIVAIYPNSKNKHLIYLQNKGLVKDFLPLKDAGGNFLLSTTLKHEIGHLFGLEHSESELSFMYISCVETYGLWTDDINQTINKNKWKKWKSIFNQIGW